MSKPPPTIDDTRREVRRRRDNTTQVERAFVLANVSRLIFNMRVSAGLSQRRMADQAGMGQSEISRLEAGRGRRGPELATLVRLARLCGFQLEVVAMRLSSGRKAAGTVVPLTPPAGGT
jgi:ribosome-binding protein aMBF1 (putative translation factor)